jgi:cobalamin-dependent methionine synthase I
MKWLKKFLAQCEVDYEAMKRGTYAGFLPLAILAGAALAKKFAANRAANSAGKEQKRVGEANAKANFESQMANEANREDDRLTRTQGIANQLSGARSLSPEVIAAALKRRQSSVRKGATVDPTKGLGWSMVGDIAGTAGDLAGSYMKGAGGAGGAAATSLMPSAGVQAPGATASGCPDYAHAAGAC